MPKTIRTFSLSPKIGRSYKKRVYKNWEYAPPPPPQGHISEVICHAKRNIFCWSCNILRQREVTTTTHITRKLFSIKITYLISTFYCLLSLCLFCWFEARPFLSDRFSRFSIPKEAKRQQLYSLETRYVIFITIFPVFIDPKADCNGFQTNSCTFVVTAIMQDDHRSTAWALARRPVEELTCTSATPDRFLDDYFQVNNSEIKLKRSQLQFPSSLRPITLKAPKR